MILEVASFNVRPEAVADFESSFAQARRVIAAAAGHLGHELHRSVDAPGRYLLLVRWRTREDHAVGFRESALYQQWRGLLHRHFAVPPVVDHLEPVTEEPQS